MLQRVWVRLSSGLGHSCVGPHDASAGARFDETTPAARPVSLKLTPRRSEHCPGANFVEIGRRARSPVGRDRSVPAARARRAAGSARGPQDPQDPQDPTDGLGLLLDETVRHRRRRTRWLTGLHRRHHRLADPHRTGRVGPGRAGRVNTAGPEYCTSASPGGEFPQWRRVGRVFQRWVAQAWRIGLRTVVIASAPSRRPGFHSAARGAREHGSRRRQGSSRPVPAHVHAVDLAGIAR